MKGIDSLICAKHQTRNLTIQVRILVDTIFHLSIHYPVVVSMYSSCWRERSELRRRLRGFRGAETAALSIMSPHGTDNSTAAPSLCLVICRGFDFLHPLDGGCSSAAEQLQKAQTKVITLAKAFKSPLILDCNKSPCRNKGKQLHWWAKTRVTAELL